MSLIGWRLPCGATVVADSASTRYPGARSVDFDRKPRALEGQLIGYTNSWSFNKDGTANGLFPNLTPLSDLDTTKRLRLSDGTPVTLLTNKALHLYSVVVITDAGNMLRCTPWGSVADDARNLENF